MFDFRTAALLALTLAVVSLAGAAHAAPIRSVTVELKDAPGLVYTGEDVTVSYRLVLTGYTWENVSLAEIRWDSTSHGGALDANLYPMASASLAGDPSGEYNSTFKAPAVPMSIYLIIHVVVDGTDYYAPSEIVIHDKASPKLVLLAHPSAWFAGSTVPLSWNITGVTAAEVDLTNVFWDTVSHSAAASVAPYPNTGDGVWIEALDADTVRGHANLTMPAQPGTVYLNVLARVNGRNFTLPQGEVGILDRASPELSKASTPTEVLPSEEVTFSWTIDYSDPGEINVTGVVYDRVSHANDAEQGRYRVLAYSSKAEGHQVLTGGPWTASVIMPSPPGKVYYMIYAYVNDAPFLLDEANITVKPMPSLLIMDGPPGAAFIGSDMTVRWTAENATPSDISNVAIHWDVASHAGDPNLSHYAHMVLGQSGAVLGEYMATLVMPAEPGTVYLVFQVVVLGRPFVSPTELQIKVKALPHVDDGPFPVEPVQIAGGLLNVSWNVEGADAAAIESTSLRLATGGTPPGADLSKYPIVVMGVALPGGAWTASYPLPATPTAVYYIVFARVMGDNFTSPAMRTVSVVGRPTVDVTSAPAVAFVGSKLTFDWMVTIPGGDPSMVNSTELLWDTSSHAGSNDTSLYPNRVAGVPTSTPLAYKADLNAPAAPAKVHFIVHAVVLGVDYYTPTERMVEVKATPALKDVSFKGSATAGKTVKVTFTLANASASDVSTVGVWWTETGTSQVGPQDPSHYERNLTVTPTADGRYSVSLKVPNKQTHVYFIVRAVVDGQSFYGAKEYDIKVEKSTPGPGAIAVVGAIALAAAAAMAATRRRR